MDELDQYHSHFIIEGKRFGSTYQTTDLVTHGGADLPRYAYGGADQYFYVTILLQDNGKGKGGISGKLQQRPNAHPLQIATYVQNGAPDFDFNYPIDLQRSIHTALGRLRIFITQIFTSLFKSDSTPHC